MKYALLFPGQGSQSVGMMNPLAHHAVVRETFGQASEILGVDFWRMITEENSDINQTVHTQPLMLAAGVATWRVLNLSGLPMPELIAGHSLGEYSALVAADSIQLEQALPLVRFRAEIMQQACADGAMAAILGLEDDKVREICAAAAADQVVEAVNFNSPGQVVIAGHSNAVARAAELAKQAGAKRAIILPVSVPSHCQLMRPAAERLAQYLQKMTFQAPKIPVLHNVSVVAHSNPEQIKQALVEQLYNPVRWVESIQYAAEQGITMYAECGPGKVLTGLNKRIQDSLPCISLTSDEAVDAIASAFVV